MGIHRDYVRLTPVELRRAVEDPAWALEHLDALGEAWVEDDREPEEARFLSVDKSWPGIEFVLALAGLREETIHGTEPLQTTEDWDYGPPTYLTSAQVTAAAERLSALPIADVVAAVDPELPRAAKLYQVGEWNDDDRDYVTYHALRLQRFYASAAMAGDALVVMLA